MMVSCRFWNLKCIARARLLSRFVSHDSAVLLPWFVVEIRSVRTRGMFGTIIWLFSLVWDLFELPLEVGFTCIFVVTDTTDLGARIMFAKALCLSLLQPIPDAEYLPFYRFNNANVCVQSDHDQNRSTCWLLWCRISTRLRRKSHRLTTAPTYICWLAIAFLATSMDMSTQTCSTCSAVFSYTGVPVESMGQSCRHLKAPWIRAWDSGVLNFIGFAWRVNSIATRRDWRRMKS